MALSISNQALALALASIIALLMSTTFAVEAHVAAPSPSPVPTPRSHISTSPSSSPSPSPSPSPSKIMEMIAHNLANIDMAKFVEANLQMTMHKLEEFNQALEKRLVDPDTSSTTKECIQQCHEVYEAAKDDINKSLLDLNGGDLFNASFEISSVANNVDTCKQCFDEMIGEDPELKQFDEWVRGVTNDCISALDEVAS